MVLRLLDQLQISWQLYLIALQALLTGLGLLQLWHLIYPRLLTGFGMLVYFTNLSVMEFQVTYLALLLLFYKWFWMESHHRNIRSMLDVFKALFLVLHLSCYTLMTFMTMLSVILLSMLIILLYKCDQSSDLWQYLELTSELECDLKDTVDWGKKWLVDFNAGKTQLVLLHQSNNNDSTDVKMNGSVLSKTGKTYIKVSCML